MNKIIKILHFEDSLLDSAMIQLMIGMGEIKHCYFLTDKKETFEKILESENIDIILSDLNLPDYDGYDALKFVREKYPHIPFIFVSGTIGEDAAINAMVNGSTDYVLKNKLERLVPAINRAIKEHDNILKQAKAEKALKESEKMLKNTQKLAHIGIWNWKADIDFTTINDEFYLITGLEETLSTPKFTALVSIFTPISRILLKNAIKRTIKTGETYQIELKLLHPDKRIRYVKAFGGAVFENNNKITELYGTIQDITQQKKAEQELIIAKFHAQESDRLKSTFLANMGHEIRTPMNGILGFTELLKKPDLEGNDKQDYIRIIEQSGNRMLNIIENIISISKIESRLSEIRISETNINELIKSIYSSIKKAANKKGLEISFTNSLTEEKASILSDGQMIRIIISNLLENAIKFSNSGKIDYGYIKKGKFLEFFVKDTGVGITFKQQKIIFDRFRQANESYTREYEGAGLGLTISKAYVEMLGGKIWVKSRSKNANSEPGTIFYFTIPYNVCGKNKDYEKASA